MRKYVAPLSGLVLVAGLCAQPLRAQGAAAPAPAIDPATIAMPDLGSTPGRETEDSDDKYVYFQRDDTDFATAYADLQECHGYASGISLRADGGPQTGGLTGVAVDAIVGATLRRDLRRRNLRTCMRFKAYRAYALSKPVWEQFNSQGDHVRLGQAEWQRQLSVQARLASGPRPRMNGAGR